jgi:hypothetical protein
VSVAMFGDETGRAIAKIGPRRLAEAITSPTALLAAGAIGGGAVAAAGPKGLIAGVLAWIGITLFNLRPKNLAAAVKAEKIRAERVDPFTLSEPWRRYVQSALDSQRRFDAAVANTSEGPVKENLTGLRDAVEDAVQECWKTSKRGAQLVKAYEQLDPQTAAQELQEAQLRVQTNRDPSRNAALEKTVASLQTQMEASERLRAGAIDAQDRLRALDAQMDEIIARTVELSATADDVGAVDELGADLDRVRLEMEAVRQGLEEAGKIERTAFGTA